MYSTIFLGCIAQTLLLTNYIAGYSIYTITPGCKMKLHKTIGRIGALCVYWGLEKGKMY